jgi:iron complex transport system substrate-binding protein
LTRTAERPRAGFPPGTVDSITRRDFLVGGAATILLAGCGSGGGGDEPSGETRTVEDGAGRSVEVPVDPQRVVVLDVHRLIFHLVELGVVPIGATTSASAFGGELPDLLGEESAEIESVGDTSSPSLEKIATLEPDLIFYNSAYDTLDLEELSGIAPTVAYDGIGFEFDIEGSLRFMAEMVNRREEAERIISDFDARVEEAASNLDLAGETFTVVEGSGESFFLLGSSLPISRMIERLGGEIVPEEVDGEPLEGISGELSLEVVSEYVNSDSIIYMRYFDGEELQESSEEFLNSPVWQSVPAVENGEVITLETHAAFGSFGFIGLNATLKRLVEELS